MKMRWLLFGIALALAPVAASAQDGTKAGDTTGPRPMIELPAMSFDFGSIYHQDQYIHAFVVRNKGTADLTIEDVKPG